jgi:hypothetical protein
MRLPADGPSGRMLGDFLFPGMERGGAAGRGQFGCLLGGRDVRQALDWSVGPAVGEIIATFHRNVAGASCSRPCPERPAPQG